MITGTGKFYFETKSENNFISVYFRYNPGDGYRMKRGFYASFHAAEIEFFPADEFSRKFGKLHYEKYTPGEGFSVFFGEIARKSKKAEEHAAAVLGENLPAYLERIAARAGLELVQPVKIAEIR